jgi:uncharacterized protein (TIGR03435 family)
MLRALLAERFKLVVHHETKEQPVYALVLARPDGKLGAQIKPSTLDCSVQPPPGQSNGCGMNSSTNNTTGLMTGRGRSIQDLGDALSNFVTERMVIDRTGLAGAFDFELRWTPDNLRGAPNPAGAAPSDAPSIFAALQEQLGLKLEAQRAPVEFVVIDKVERPEPN